MKSARYFSAVAILSAMIVGGAASAMAQSGARTGIPGKITKIGSFDLRSGSVTVATNSPASAMPKLTDSERQAITTARAFAVNRPIPHHGGGTHAAVQRQLASVPTVKSTGIATTNPRLFGFKGITAYSSDLAQTNPSFTEIEPPDQGLCVGNGKVLEFVNLAMAVYDTNGNLTNGPIPLDSFFSSSTDFISDPRCNYDAATNSFFFSITDLGDYPTSISGPSSILLGVVAADTLTGTLYSIDTTAGDGSLDCPCFEDQPLLGVDNYGVYISANEFQITAPSVNSSFNGAQLFAVNKADLVAGAITPGVMRFEDLAVGPDDAFSVQPAFTPAASQLDTNNGGTEYFLSSLDFAQSSAGSIAVWAITNTCGLPSSGTAACVNTPTLSSEVLSSETYAVAPNAVQKAGYIPVGSIVGGSRATLDTDDDRMQQVMLSNGKLYSALTTAANVAGVRRAGIAYFVVQPSIVSGSLSGSSITSQGYFAHSGAYLFYPSFAVNENGSALLAFTLSGGLIFPGAAYIPMSTDIGKSVIHYARHGAGTYDGATGYPAFGGPPARWGDYSAGVADNGVLWMANEYVSGTCTKTIYLKSGGTCGGKRGVGSNWGTFVSRITPP